MKACVFGAGGFIGSHLVKRLKKEGYWVRGVDLKYPEFSKTEADEFMIGDLRYAPFCFHSLMLPGFERFDELYQLAADMGGAGFVFTGDHDADIMHNSVQINLNALQYSNRYNKVFYSSSACMYPEHNQLDPLNPKCSEDSAYPASPDSEYGWEKLFSERLYLAYARNYKVNVKIARFHNIFGPCYDDKTEVLTKTGWKFFKDIKIEDKIASLSKDNKLEYLQPIEKQAYNYSGEMFKVEGKAISQLVTPDHKLYMSLLTTKNNKTIQTEYNLIEAKNIKWNTNKLFFTSYCDWDGRKYDKYILPDVVMKDGRKLYESRLIDAKDWFEFIGWYVTEGSRFITKSNYTICITQYEKKNQKNREQIKNLLNRMNIHFSEDKNKTQIIISNKQLYNALDSESIGIGSTNKKIPSWMLDSDKELLNILFESMMLGDGNKDGSRFSTVSKILKDQFMELCLKLGKAITCSENELPKKPSHNQIYRIFISDRKQFCSKRNTRTKELYNGMVYDVTLPRNHILMIRRNGKVCWSGNCGTWKGGREKAPAAFCRKIITAKDSIDMWGDGEQTRSFLYIDECIEGVRRLMESNFTGPVNIGSEEMVSMNHLAYIIMNIEHKPLKINHINGPIGVRGRNSDNKLIKEVLNWVPSYSLELGIKNTYFWIKDQISKSQTLCY